MTGKKALLLAGMGVGGYMLWKWYKEDSVKRQAKSSLRLPEAPLPAVDPNAPRTNSGMSGFGAPVTSPDPASGYGRVEADPAQANAWGAQTAETDPALNLEPPNVVIGDAESAPEGAGFFDDDEFTAEAAF